MQDLHKRPFAHRLHLGTIQPPYIVKLICTVSGRKYS